VTAALLDEVMEQEMKTIATEVGAERFGSGRFEEARDLFRRLSTADSLEEFLTIPAYELLDSGVPTAERERGNP
jgi:Malate synthase